MVRLHPSLQLVLVVFLLTAYAITSHAQTDLPGAEVRVEKLFDARLADAQRIELSPKLPQLDTAIVAQRYEVIPVDAEVDYEPPSIRPLAVKTEAPPTAYKGFVRAGAGFPLAWIGDASYLTRSDQVAFRADVHTYGFDGNFNEDQKYYEVDSRLGATYYSNGGVAFDLDLGYDRRQFRYFGYREAVMDTSIVLPEEQIEQYFGVFSLGAGIRNTKENPLGLDYHAKVTADLLSDNFATKERNLLIDLGARRSFGTNWYGEVGILADLTSFEAVADQSLNNYSFTPRVGAHFDNLGYHLGATVTSSNDTFRVFPNLELSYGLGGGFVLVAGADGGLRKNNYTSLTAYNPYLVTDPLLRNAEEWRGYVSLQGQTRGVTYTATASYSRVNNLAVFVQDDERLYQFAPAYDTASIIGLRVDASMPVSERLSGRLQLENRIFSLERFEKPFLLPSFDATVTLSYEVIPERFTAEALLITQNALPYGQLNDAGTLEDVDGFTTTLADLSLHGTYQFSKRFGAFGQLNNLLNNRRRQFAFYPNLGTNVLVGLVAKF